MEAWVVAIVVLVAVLVGATIPLLVQARATLMSAQRLMDDTRPRLSRTLDELHSTTQRLNVAASTLDGRGPQVTAFFDAVGALTVQVNQLRGSVKLASAVGAAIGPAIAAALQAFRNAQSANDETEEDDDDTNDGGDPATKGDV